MNQNNFPFWHFFKPSRLVFRRGAPRSTTEDDDTENGLESSGRPGTNLGATQKKVQEIQAKAFQNPEVRVKAREAAVDQDPLKRSMVDQLLQGKMNEAQFLEEIGKYEERENQNKAWERIFGVQRAVREKIDNLHERAEAYLEAIPTESMRVADYLEQLRMLNHQDAQVDGDLKRLLHESTQPIEVAQGVAPMAPVLSQGDAKTLYHLNPQNPSFEQEFKRLTHNFRRHEADLRGGKKLKQMESTLVALKRQELDIERKFADLCDKIEKLISYNLQKVNRVQEEERQKQIATRAIGIAIESGTNIKYEDTDFLGLGRRTKRVKITAVTFDRVPVFDNKGKVMTYIVGAPLIRLDDGGKPMTLGRFKKWVDATNAVEEILNLHELEDKIGWSKLGLHLKPGISLQYQTLHRMSDGTLKRQGHDVVIQKIGDGKVTFSTPVNFQRSPAHGSQHIDEPEVRESLDFAEFGKWYLRNETEMAFTLAELRKSLKSLNTLVNSTFHVTTKDNPPIEVADNEVLYYPDGSGMQFQITKVSNSKIVLDNGMAYTPAQFFYWVRHNFVQKDPKSRPTGAQIPEAIALERKRQEEIKQREELKRRYQEENPDAHGHGPAHEEKDEHGKKKKKEEKPYELPPEAQGPINALKRAWYGYTFLSFKDIWHMVVAVKEFVVRRHERRSKERYGSVGSRLPGLLGAEFQKIRQGAEDEEVHQFMEPMKHMGIFDVKRILHQTNNRDVAKACIEVLMEKGEMRFDDHHFHATLNRLTARYTTRGAELYIGHEIKPGVGGPEDQTHPAMDALWGQGTGSEWFQKNISAYNSAKKNYDFKGNQLEADPKGTGGLAGELKRLLSQWKAGEYVNPMEYEELIDFAIDKGKMGAGDKIYYLIMGVITTNSKMGDESLLHLDRIGQLDGVYLNRFPLLDFFTNKDANRPDGTKGAWRTKDYEMIAHTWFPDDMRANKPGKQTAKFIWEYMMFDSQFRTRLSKGLRNADQIDHDDANLFIPPASEEEIEKLTDNFAGGSKTYFTPEGYANAYCGFGQYLYSIAAKHWKPEEEDQKQQSLRDVLKGLVRYDAILDNRYLKKEGSKRARLSEHHYNRRSVCSIEKTGTHQLQLKNLIISIGKAYGRDFSELYKKTGSYNDPEQKKEQDRLERLHQEFGSMVSEMLAEDAGQKAIDEITKAKNRPAKSPNGLMGMNLDAPDD